MSLSKESIASAFKSKQVDSIRQISDSFDEVYPILRSNPELFEDIGLSASMFLSVFYETKKDKKNLSPFHQHQLYKWLPEEKKEQLSFEKLITLNQTVALDFLINHFLPKCEVNDNEYHYTINKSMLLFLKQDIDPYAVNYLYSNVDTVIERCPEYAFAILSTFIIDDDSQALFDEALGENKEVWSRDLNFFNLYCNSVQEMGHEMAVRGLLHAVNSIRSGFLRSSVIEAVFKDVMQTVRLGLDAGSPNVLNSAGFSAIQGMIDLNMVELNSVVEGLALNRSDFMLLCDKNQGAFLYNFVLKSAFSEKNMDVILNKKIQKRSLFRVIANYNELTRSVFVNTMLKDEGLMNKFCNHSEIASFLKLKKVKELNNYDKLLSTINHTKLSQLLDAEEVESSVVRIKKI